MLRWQTLSVSHIPSFENTPENIGTANEKPKDKTQISVSGLTSVNTPLSSGTYMHKSRQAIDTTTANSINGFDKNGTEKRVFSSLLHSKTCISCDAISVIKAPVLASSSVQPSFKSVVKQPRVQSPISIPRRIILPKRPPLKKLSDSFLGGLCMTDFSPGSSPNATAGSPSVTRFTSSICAGKSTIADVA